MKILFFALALIAGYLLGNVQTSVLVSRTYFKDDVRHHGSGNAGSTNMVRVFGVGPGVFTFVGDFVKGILAVLIGRWIAGEMGGYCCALGAVLGHNFPVFFGFKGGKGVATTFGIVWMLSPLCAAIITPIAFGTIILTKMVSPGSMVGMTVYFILTFIFHPGEWWFIGTAGILWLLLVLRHIENIKRLLRGEESKLFGSKKPQPEQVKEKKEEQA